MVSIRFKIRLLHILNVPGRIAIKVSKHTIRIPVIEKPDEKGRVEKGPDKNGPDKKGSDEKGRVEKGSDEKGANRVERPQRFFRTNSVSHHIRLYI